MRIQRGSLHDKSSENGDQMEQCITRLSLRKQTVNIRHTVNHVIRTSIQIGESALWSQAQGETRKCDVSDIRIFLTG